MKLAQLVTVLSLLVLLFTACGGGAEEPTSGEPPKSMIEDKKEIDPMTLKGVGPITAVDLGELDPALAEKGKELYEGKCTACHRVDQKFIGPAPKGILERRTPEWVMNMILNPEGMVKEDPVAKQLLIEYNGSPMANQSLTEGEARSILEYFRTL